jgi:hypothetical protein
MLKIIVTKQNSDGTYDEVGMNNRTLFSHYTTVRGAMKYGVLPYGKGKAIRVEVYPGGLTDICNWILYFDKDGKRVYNNDLRAFNN